MWRHGLTLVAIVGVLYALDRWLHRSTRRDPDDYPRLPPGD